MFLRLPLAMLTIALSAHASPIHTSAAPSPSAISGTCTPGQYQCNSPDTYSICYQVGVWPNTSWAWTEPRQMAEGVICGGPTYPGPYSIATASSSRPTTTYTLVSSMPLSGATVLHSTPATSPTSILISTASLTSTSAMLSASSSLSNTVTSSAAVLTSVWSSSSTPLASVTSAATTLPPVSSSVLASVTVPPPLTTVTPPVVMTASINNTRAVSQLKNAEGNTSNPDVYTMYTGDGGLGWPEMSDWMSFEDMWNRNLPLIKNNCQDQSDEETQQVGGAIQAIAQTSLVDRRHILATIIQESKGCVRVHTTSNPSCNNPGLMQSYNGTGSCNNGTALTPCPAPAILQMVQDGSMGVMNGDSGTSVGLGLVQHLNNVAVVNGTGAQAFYQASRMYNSGSILDYNDLGAPGATACYVADVANRLTGWVAAPHGCVPGSNGTAVAAPTYRKRVVRR